MHRRMRLDHLRSHRNSWQSKAGFPATHVFQFLAGGSSRPECRAYHPDPTNAQTRASTWSVNQFHQQPVQPPHIRTDPDRQIQSCPMGWDPQTNHFRQHPGRAQSPVLRFGPAHSQANRQSLLTRQQVALTTGDPRPQSSNLSELAAR